MWIMWLIGEVMIFGFMYILFWNNYRTNEYLRTIISWIRRKKEGITEKTAVIILTVACWIFLSIIITLFAVLIALIKKMFELLLIYDAFYKM